jgi:Domain of unknown function (DUF6894)
VTVPRFFFNYREGGEYTHDRLGIEFETFELAYLDAFDAAREMWPEIMDRRVDPRICGFDIVNSDGVVVALVNFGEVLENCTRGRPVTAGKILLSCSEAVNNANRARRMLSEFQEQIDQTRRQLAAVRQLVGQLTLPFQGIDSTCDANGAAAASVNRT